VLQTREIPANRLNYLRLIQAVSRPEMDLKQLESFIKSEAWVLYRLLRYLNSARFGFAGEIHTVRHAMTLLGEHELRRWVRLVALVSAGLHKSSDLVLSALVRARFCELLSTRIRKSDSDLFLVGLLSEMDAILEIPVSQILEKIPIDQDIRSAAGWKRSASLGLPTDVGTGVRQLGKGPGICRASGHQRKPNCGIPVGRNEVGA
jgi:EAL and modified HD-GYP domain-containing signal transduction protein